MMMRTDLEAPELRFFAQFEIKKLCTTQNCVVFGTVGFVMTT